ncbi:STK19 [Branchiostoma lanceolatum]|uniref:STK19 protein n=1 Tax=Branchiostoma lanceolatum TaxID=7740 RepID=A0A8K0F1N1_BRALA|nr:STK19 [Branchiostoma lanceolatum]
MMSKRKALMPDVFKRRKRVRVGGLVRPTPSSPQWGSDNEEHISAAVPSDTKAAIMYLCSLFPKQMYEGRIPPIIMKHQLYSVVKNKTLVDRQLNDLRNAHEVKMMKLGNEVDEYCLVFTEDYKNHIATFYGQELSKTVERFLEDVVSRTNEMCVTQQIMTDHNFTDVEITQLVNAGVLTVRDLGSWWLAIPGAGLFVKHFTKGKKAVLASIRKSKYKEILKQELESRKMTASVKLGMSYHIHDIIGGDLVTCIETTSGELLRLKDD